MLGDADRVTTCGMHVFSLPDSETALADHTDAETANAFLLSLNVYQLAEDPMLLSGHRFAPDPETPQRPLVRWPDASYAPEHPCHNSFGVWRVGPPGSRAPSPGKLALVFMPALAALLSAAEDAAGTGLTREQVEAIRDKAVCVTMEHRHAQRLERSRGYADLEPSQAWEQWQVLQRHRR